MKKHLSTIIVTVIFLCGLSLFLYPTVSDLYNQYLNHKLIGDYERSFSNTTPKQFDEEMEKAVSYNENRENKEKLKELGLTYEGVLNTTGNGVMGYIEIPKISVSLIIYHTIEEDVLQTGIGHLPETDLPIGGDSTHCVLAGHTGLPSAKLLTNIDQLKQGDRFYIHVLNEVLEYKIDDVSVVEPDEVSRLSVVSGKDYVTLVTCTPYGVNSHRLLVRGVRVDGTHFSAKEDGTMNELLHIDMKYLLTFSLIGLCIIFVAVKKLRSIRKKKGPGIFILMLVITLAASPVLSCFAAETGAITVNLEDKDKNKINGTTVHLCQVAGLNNTGFYPMEVFEDSDISVSGIINNPTNSVAEAIRNYVKENHIDTLTGVSENGKVSFSGLNLGIWIVYCDNESEYTFNPYIVFLPQESAGKLYYEIDSAPKVEDNFSDKISIYVVKQWSDDNNAIGKRPDSIMVELLDGGSSVASVKLSEENGWAFTFTNLSKEGEYSVREKKVADYVVDYSGDARNGFVITNTYSGEKLPQTGQYWWPITVICIAGVCFVLLGISELGVKKNEEEK